jgi:hypothetical protein
VSTLEGLLLGAAFGISIGSFLIVLGLTRKLAATAAMVDWHEREIEHLMLGYRMLMRDLLRRLPEDVSAPQSTDAYLGATKDTQH